MTAPRWNHNIHYQRLVFDRVPPGAQRALDVGCGEGVLTRELARLVPHVVGIDRDVASIALARAQGGADYVLDDVLTHDFADGFDLVACVAALHHMDAAAALHRMHALVRPGGRLVVIGCARRELPHDLPWEIAGAVRTRVLKARHGGYWQHCAPIVDPELTHPQTRRIAAAELPGCRYRQLAMWRYLLDWTRPG